MSTTAERICQTAQQLPDSLALEALHYMEYLRTRANATEGESNLMQAQQPSMQQVWDNPDDEVWNVQPTR
ncbi:hypothetical protein D5125_02650 [Magnetovirga frankeli]|uniref:hypothetical protein n=1 Tax=Magnetovirga frankeli TaxID=947516 RepID=UPI00129322CC|nr:hypothetical protein D5125_02650 [gamma proteobacterium SS-5]